MTAKRLPPTPTELDPLWARVGTWVKNCASEAKVMTRFPQRTLPNRLGSCRDWRDRATDAAPISNAQPSMGLNLLDPTTEI